MLVQDVLNASGRLLGELRADRSFGPNESAQLLISLNNMLGAWSEGQWAIHQITRETLAMNGLSSYTFGGGGSLSSVRPIRIERIATINSSSIRLPGRVVTAAEFAAASPDITATGAFVEMLWPDYGDPLCNMAIYPNVNFGSTLELFSLKPLPALGLLTQFLELPVGYEEALVYNFACKIAPEFGKQPSADVMRVAETSKAAIAAMNLQLYPPQATKTAA